MASTSGVPQISTTIPQDFIIEALGGPTQPSALLDRFPDTVYVKSPESHLVRFMYALLGPSGVGQIAKSFLEARLQLEDLGLELFDLDAFFGDPFSFGRLLDEDYTDDTSGLLPNDDQQRIAARDAQYRSRALDFFGGARLGNSPRGMQLVARAGLGHDVEIIENYRYLFDFHSDDPKGYKYFGQTASTQEMVVLPRQEISKSEQQTITLYGHPTGGYITPLFNGRTADDPLFQNITFDAPAVSDWVDAPGFVQTLPGGYTVVDRQISKLGVQEILESHPDIGRGNVRVTGGPGPENPWVVTFIGALAGQDVSEIGIYGDPNETLTGGDPQRDAKVTTTVGGVDSANEDATIAARDLYHLQQALDRLRAITTIPTVADASGVHSIVPANGAYATSEYVCVLRYVTGNPSVQWPTPNAYYWIQNFQETEAPTAWAAGRQHYQGFHNIAAATAYTDSALQDAGYESGSIALENLSEHTGNFNPAETALFPALLGVTPGTRFTADRAAADYPEQPVVTGLDPTGAVPLIQGIYPITYSGLAGVPAIKYKDEQFWSSFERAEGAEYLEVDLGSVQAVNFVGFETLRKPLTIEITYDYLDQPPRRRFVPVTPSDRTNYPDQVSYSGEAGWTYLEFNFGDVTGAPVYARYLRIGLTRNVTASSPFLVDALTGQQTPWTVEVRNLRVGRNVSN